MAYTDGAYECFLPQHVSTRVVLFINYLEGIVLFVNLERMTFLQVDVWIMSMQQVNGGWHR